MSGKSLLQWLQGAGLEQLYDTFVAHDITVERLPTLQFQDYDRMEIVEPPLRQKLFRLVQAAKREQPLHAPPPQQQPQPVQQPVQQLAPTQVLPRGLVQPSQIQQPAANSSRMQKPAASALPAPRPVARYEEPPQPAPAPAPVRNKRVSTLPQQQPPPPVQQAPPPRQQQLPPQRQAEPEYEEDDNGGDQDADEDEDDAEGSVLLDEYGGDEEARYLADIPKIRVAVRKRPINTKERDSGQVDVVTVNRTPAAAQITVHEPKQKVDLTRYVESHKFAFDEVYGDDSTNEEIYAATCRPLVHFFVNKGKASCFAFGQTGSGKTFTMMGNGEASGPAMGLYAMAARDMFRLLQSGGEKLASLQVFCSFFEIYGGKLFDLLNDRKKLVMREDGAKNVQIVGLRERKCNNVADLLELMSYGNAVRSTGSTGANMDSSRSHAILQIVLKKPDTSAASVPAFPGQANKAKLKVHGKFSFIDLAGSERGADTSDNDRRTRLEGAEINKSLLALKECFRALDQGAKHLPFRGSQLTQVLRDSFVGQSKTVMIANVSPNSGGCENTLNTLRYADRVKELKKGQGQGAAGAKGYDAYMPHQGKQGKRNFDVDQSAAVFQPQAQLPPPAAPINAAAAAQPAAQPTKAAKSSRASLLPEQKPFVKPLASALGRVGASQAGALAPSPTDRDEPDALEKTYMDLGSTILREEESIVEAHRAQIDSTMKGVKEEMELLKRFDTNGHSVDDYVDRLDELLQRKIAGIQELKHKLQMFKKHLKQEEELSSSLNRKRNGGGGSGGSWGGGQSGYDDDEQPPQPPPSGGGRPYPHLHPLPNSNYNR